jgi:aspartyl-tRNA(Asn)/glutamyl-tRNA(Gln) amidotransferase subunit A
VTPSSRSHCNKAYAVEVHTLVEQAGGVASGDVSPIELTEAALDALDRVQPKLNAFTTTLADRALARAKELAEASSVGPLHGVPIAVKDLYDIAGIPTTGCCAAYNSRIASSSSAVVEALERAGAIIIAKTNQHELACGATTQISSAGPCFNPWGEGRIPGGSSGGSGAAVASGVVAMAMGSDTGGSIRIPASFCGVTGLKPTHGAVSLRGAMPMCPSLDTAGPLTRSAEDCALVHRVIAGYDEEYLWSRAGEALDPVASMDGVRVVIPRSFFELVHPETHAGLDVAAKTLESLGATIEEVDGPDVERTWQAFTMRLAEVSHCYRDLWDSDAISPELTQFIALGRHITAADAFGGREQSIQVRRDFERALADADAMLAPCTVYPAPAATDQVVTLEDGKTLDVHSGGPARVTLPVNVAGLPALAFPIGFSSEGMPLGAQLIGPDWSEFRLCSIVAEYQRATDWHLREPATSG